MNNADKATLAVAEDRDGIATDAMRVLISSVPPNAAELRTAPWQRRVYWFAGGQLNAIIAAMLGVPPLTVPSYDRGATVTSDGFVMVGFTDSHGEYHNAAFAGALDDLLRNLKGLADYVSLNREDRAAFADTVMGWFSGSYLAGGRADLLSRVREALNLNGAAPDVDADSLSDERHRAEDTAPNA